MNDLGLAQRLQNVHAATAEQRGVDLKGRIFGRGANEPERATFDVGQKGILLGAVEAVDLVDEENGSRPHSCRALGVRHDLLDLLNAAGYGGELDERGLRRGGDDFGERGFARARRPPEDHGSRLIAFDGDPQRLARAEQVLLADVALQRARPHAFGERNASHTGRAGSAGAEQTHASQSLRPGYAAGQLRRAAAIRRRRR